MQGGTHRRRCTHKAEHSTSGVWQPHESGYLRGDRGAGRRVERSELHVGGAGRGGGVKI